MNYLWYKIRSQFSFSTPRVCAVFALIISGCLNFKESYPSVWLKRVKKIKREDYVNGNIDRKHTFFDSYMEVGRWLGNVPFQDAIVKKHRFVS